MTKTSTYNKLLIKWLTQFSILWILHALHFKSHLSCLIMSSTGTCYKDGISEIIDNLWKLCFSFCWLLKLKHSGRFLVDIFVGEDYRKPMLRSHAWYELMFWKNQLVSWKIFKLMLDGVSVNRIKISVVKANQRAYWKHHFENQF